MSIRNWTYSGRTSSAPTKAETAHASLAKKAAAASIVLLKNDGVLPLNPSQPIALFGNGASKTVKGGIGSGDVNNRKNVSIFEGLTERGTTITSTRWITDYDQRYDNARKDWMEKIYEDAKHVDNAFDAYAMNPFALPDGGEILSDDLLGAAAILYVISRISGEGKDRRLEDGDYYLSRKERADLMQLGKCGLPIVLMINAGGPVELCDMLEEVPQIKAVLNLSQLGQEGGHAVADVLFGDVNPEGKLTATWAKRYEDYPYGESFSHLNGDLTTEEYRDGIYVGYRYFDSFGVRPLYPFGFGLSYTSFAIKAGELLTKPHTLTVTATVTNTGSVPGREVVQIYALFSSNGSLREAQRLIGFKKTATIKPGESETVTIPIPAKMLAGFETEQSLWKIDAGDYGIAIGNSSDAAPLAFILRVHETTVIERTHPICPLDAPLDELDAPSEGARPLAHSRNLPVISWKPEMDACVTCSTNATDIDAPVEDLIPMLYGNMTVGASNLGSAGKRVPGSAGETTEALEVKYGIRSLIMADGPAGLRLRQSYQVDRASGEVYGVGVFGSLENGILEPFVWHENADTYYQFCTAFPVGTALAQTWDTDLLFAFGQAIAEEMEEYHVDLWLAPGMNIQRNPLCGRNFEYFSEDPLLSGLAAAAITNGVQSHPSVGVTIKHFAGNNQEDNRMGVNARISEQALREVYLRGFEIAVKESAPVAIMTSYNLINGVHSANSYDLCDTLARKEWGFDGIIMSDWNTTVPEDGSLPWKCAAAGNDIIMPGNPDDEADIKAALADGRLSEDDVRASANRVISLVQRFQ